MKNPTVVYFLFFEQQQNIWQQPLQEDFQYAWNNFCKLSNITYCSALVFQYLLAGRKEGLAYLRLREEITI